MMRRVRPQLVPGFGDGDRACGGKITTKVTVTFQRRGDRRVIGAAQDDGDLTRGEPFRGGEVCCAQRGNERSEERRVGKECRSRGAAEGREKKSEEGRRQDRR